jgi:hypothetical protein
MKMPRGSVSDGVTHLSDSIVACGVLPLLARFRKHGWKDRPAPAALLACYACFAADENDFGPAERTILREFEIGCIAQADWWARLVVAVAEPEPTPSLMAELVDLHAKLRLVADTLPNVIGEPPPEAAEPGMALLRVLLPSAEEGSAHPLRLSTAIEAVCMLWNVVGEIGGGHGALSMTACEPMPEITLVFAGPQAQVGELKALLMQVWERIVTSHKASLQERLEIIPHSLPAMQRIGTGNQAAMAQRRTLEAGVRMFLEVGACIPEMNDPERFTPARLVQVSDTLQGDGALACGLRHVRPEAEDAAMEAIVAEERAHLRQALPVKPAWLGKMRVG